MHLVNKIWALGILNRHTSTHTAMLILCVNVMEFQSLGTFNSGCVCEGALGVLGETGF